MEITIQNETINQESIVKIYPVAIIETGEENETTHISIEWLDNEGLGKVVLVGYAIVVNLKDTDRKEYFFATRDEFDIAMFDLKQQLT